MFFKRKLILNILNAVNYNIYIFKDDMKNLLKKYNGIQDDVPENEYLEIRSKYLNIVYGYVKSLYKNNKKLYFKILELENDPSAIGYDININSNMGFLGGTIFAIIYYAKKNKPAGSGECVFLNHRTNDVMNQILEELE